MFTVNNALTLATFLQKRNLWKATRNQMLSMLSQHLHLDVLRLIVDKNQKLTRWQSLQWLLYLFQAVFGKPVAYILKSRQFYAHNFYVNHHVLIPRLESEQLVRMVLQEKSRHRLLDMGCGSGCLGLSIKLARPDWHVSLSDISKNALDVAKRNAGRLQLASEQLEFYQSDLFFQLKGLNPFSIIIANLPYVTRSEWQRCERQVRKFEPRLALVCDDPLQFYQRFFRESQRFLAIDGWIMLELSPMIIQSVHNLAASFFSFSKIVIDDYERSRFLLVKNPK